MTTLIKLEDVCGTCNRNLYVNEDTNTPLCVACTFGGK